MSRLDAETCRRLIAPQRVQMRSLLMELASINSGTLHLAGLERVGQVLARELKHRLGEPTWIDLPPREAIDDRGNLTAQPVGRALRLTRPADTSAPAAPRVLLNIHYDTVYEPDHPFQTCTHLDAHTLRGPGVADAKGGIVVMLAALQAFEASPRAGGIAWEVILNPDEEIGSPGSMLLLHDAGQRNDLGLLFEPSLPDGALVSSRKGSGNYSLIVQGKAAHVGRNFEDGRNAIHALAAEVARLAALNVEAKENADPKGKGIILNVGKIDGGGAANAVPELAIARINARAVTPEQMHVVQQQLAAAVSRLNQREGFRAELHGAFYSPPKPLDERTAALLELVRTCGQELDMNLTWRPTGGASDGNKLAAAGLPNIDTLGPVGGNLHSPDEYVRLDSLTERAELTTLLLMRLAEGDLA